MATSLSISSAQVQLAWSLSSTTSFGTSTVNSSSFTSSPTFSNGTGAGYAQKLFVDSVSIANGAPQSYDLSGSLTDPTLNACVFTNVKGIFIQHTTTTATGLLTLSGNFLANSGSCMGGTSPTLIIKPSGTFFLNVGTTPAAGYTVTNSTGDTITLTNADASAVTVKVAIWGE